MKTIKIAFLLLVIASQSISAFELNVDTIILQCDSYKIEQLIVSISNTENEPLWIWLDNQDYSQDERRAIKSYLMKRKGDFSIFDIGTNPLMEGKWWSPSGLQECFVKYLKPGSIFSIILYIESNSEEEAYIQNRNIIDFVKVYKNQQVREVCAGIDESYSVKRISYPHNVVAIPMKK